YTSELQRLVPASAGEEWKGYASQLVSYDNTTGEQNFTASADFGLPAQSNGAPFAGPFKYRVVVGGRQGASDVNEPIDCGSSAFLSFGGPGCTYSIICIDAPDQPTTATDASLLTRDAGIVPGPTVKVAAGKTAKLPFTFVYDGAPPGTGF